MSDDSSSDEDSDLLNARTGMQTSARSAAGKRKRLVDGEGRESDSQPRWTARDDLDDLTHARGSYMTLDSLTHSRRSSGRVSEGPGGAWPGRCPPPADLDIVLCCRAGGVL